MLNMGAAIGKLHCPPEVAWIPMRVDDRDTPAYRPNVPK